MGREYSRTERTVAEARPRKNHQHRYTSWHEPNVIPTSGARESSSTVSSVRRLRCACQLQRYTLLGVLFFGAITSIGVSAAAAEVPQSQASRSLEVCDPSVIPISGSGVTSILESNSAPAREVRSLGYLVVAICAGIFVVVQTFLVLAIVRGVRASRVANASASSGAEPVQVFGSLPIEVAWTVIPFIIVFVLTMVTIRTIRDIDLTKPPEGALTVTTIGHQWWWEFRYTAADGSTVITANEMHIPAGRPIWVELKSADVIHSFWVPRLAGKLDVIPGKTNALWIEADVPGIYLGQCAEYCGTQHAHMLLRVYAEEPAQFDAWLAAQAAPAVEDATVTVGRDTFTAFSCFNCHAIAGTSEGLFGPNLTHLASRDTIGSGSIPLTRSNLVQWILDPNTLKPGCNMPSLKLEPAQVESIVDYLMTLK